MKISEPVFLQMEENNVDYNGYHSYVHFETVLQTQYSDLFSIGGRTSIILSHVQRYWKWETFVFLTIDVTKIYFAFTVFIKCSTREKVQHCHIPNYNKVGDLYRTKPDWPIRAWHHNVGRGPIRRTNSNRNRLGLTGEGKGRTQGGRCLGVMPVEQSKAYSDRPFRGLWRHRHSKVPKFTQQI